MLLFTQIVIWSCIVLSLLCIVVGIVKSMGETPTPAKDGHNAFNTLLLSLILYWVLQLAT